MQVRRSSTCCAALLFIVSLLAVSCSSSTPPETIARKFIEASENAFEERDIFALKKLVSPQYGDSQNRSANEIISTAAAYIRSSGSIYVLTDLHTAEYVEERIQARLLAAFAARPIAEPALLAQMQADIYWFDIELTAESGTWKLTDAQWRQALVEDFTGSAGQN